MFIYQNRNKLKKACVYFVILSCLVLIALESEQVMPAAREVLLLCYRSVIPSLFPFFVLSGMLIDFGFVNVCARFLSGLMKPFFKVGGSGALSLVIGLISGYPMGAKMTAELYKKRKISKTEAERLLPFCNNAGPLFIVGAIGAGMLQNVKIGLFLYLIHGFCAFLVGFCFRFYKSHVLPGKDRLSSENEPLKTLTESFSASVGQAVDTVLSVCGFILFFGAVNACLLPLFSKFLSPFSVTILQGFLEITGGIQGVLEAKLPFRITLALISFFLGFGGVCVMMQAKGMLRGTDVSLKTYAMGKLLHGILSATVTYFLLPFFSEKVQPVFAYETSGILWGNAWGKQHGLSLVFLIFCCIFLCIKQKRSN